MLRQFQKKESARLNTEAPDVRAIGGKYQNEIDFRPGQESSPGPEAGRRIVLPKWEAETEVW